MHALVIWVSRLAHGPLRMGVVGLWKKVPASTPALVFGLRLSTSVCLALLIAFWLQLENPYWAATSASIVAQPGLGASLRKGRYRAVGTVIGGIAIVLLTVFLPQHHAEFLVGLALWGAICGCFATILPNFAGYAAALAGYTAAVVFAGIIANPQDVFLTAVWRVTEIGIGIFSAGLVHALTDFGDARARLAQELAQISQGIAAGLMQTLRAGRDELELRTSRRKLIQRVIGMDTMIDEAIGEPSYLRYHSGALHATMESLFVALSAWRGIANHLDVVSQQRSPALAALLPGISRLADLNWLDAPQAVSEVRAAGRQAVAITSVTDLSSRLVVERASRMLRAFERVADTLVLV